MNCSLLGSSVHGISQARILEWVAMPSSRGSSQPRDGAHVSCLGRQILLPLSHCSFLPLSFQQNKQTYHLMYTLSSSNASRLFHGCSRFLWRPALRMVCYHLFLPWPLNRSARLPAAAAKSLQSCLTLCDPTDGSPPGSPVPWILQARTLEWVAISFSNTWKWKVKVKSLSRVRLLVTPWTTAHQALHPWDFPGKSTGVGCHCLLRMSLQIKLFSFKR